MRPCWLRWMGTALGVAGAWLAAGQGRGAGPQPRDFVKARNQLVDEEIVGAGVKDPRVIQSMRDTPRHEFVPIAERANAYVDMALPIGSGQTISPPFVVAYMTEQIEPKPDDVVLEIGTGSGYQAAILSPLVKQVYTIEIVESLGKRAASTLKRLKYQNIVTKIGDGYKGWPEHAPFDKVIVTCSPENVPQPLIDQLKEGGRMVVPLGERYQQSLYLFKKVEGKLVREALLPTLFVPMTGAAEENRKVLPDPLHPQVVNGGFEETYANDDAKPAGWHYQRQLKLVDATDAPEGKRFVTFTNALAGRNSAALQAIPIDGRKIKEVEITAKVKGGGIVPAPIDMDKPGIAMAFYDRDRKSAGYQNYADWHGSFGWQAVTFKFRIPPEAREAIIRIGLLGSVGELSVDSVELEVVSRRGEDPKR